ncbi:hypothetical protein LAZ67_8001495 [Cordylochernes scorpioides]|uniref:Uncharacterized protein n=1 Tax=Cordylochernes scorpioides TaxID=51811 RepID=A0ABY6KQ89_9ARAC|nr:hypothetical protein LAZ67_8001495 [Cordylochernes scorpioides]
MKNEGLNKSLANFLFTYRSVPQSSTKEAPAVLFLKKMPKSRWNLLRPNFESKAKLGKKTFPEFELVEVYGEKCMDVKNVRKWCREIYEDRENVHDEQRSGRPSLPESTVARFYEMVRKNRRIILHEIMEGLNEEYGYFSMYNIVSEVLGPDIAPSDYHLFPALKKHLARQKLELDEEVQEAVAFATRRRMGAPLQNRRRWRRRRIGLVQELREGFCPT